MRLSRVTIKNFRNFNLLDVQLGQHAVVLGENKIGKTNLLFALRLILDPTLPDSARRLRLDDFWDGLARPLSATDAIEISVEFREFDNSPLLLAVLADHLIQPAPMVAKVTYRFQPIAGLGRVPRSEADYEFVVFGGNRPENAVTYELRRWMPMDLFPALRIEEPEAHLHPHLQRMIYRNYLRSRDDSERQAEPRSILLTTHSPNVASVAPLANIVVLKHAANGRDTVARSLHGVKLNDADREDLERYMDVTRGELFFAKGVILVEGDAEKFLLPTLAKLYDKAFDFDALGITVCSIAGTNFAPYVKLLGPGGLDLPFVVITDFDPKGSENSQEDEDPEEGGVESSYGENRVVNQILRHILPVAEWKDLSFEEVLALAPEKGVFLNEFTFEVDVFNAKAESYFHQAVKAATGNKAMHARFEALGDAPLTLDAKQFLKDIDSIGKGRFAQRLASVLLEEDADVCPPYIKAALEYMRRKLA